MSGDACSPEPEQKDFLRQAEQAQKFDGGKLPLQLLSTEALNRIAEVLAHGAQKYSANQWRDGMRWSRLIGAAFRHLTAFNDGEDLDDESGMSHLAHLGCCVLFLLEYAKTHPDKDDRYHSFHEQVRRLSRNKPLIESATYRGESIQALRLLGHPGEELEDTYVRLYPDLGV